MAARRRAFTAARAALLTEGGSCVTLSLALFFAPAPYASAGDAPRRIQQIEIIRTNVFDADEQREMHFLGSVVNSLHVVTREDVIRRELLFQEGDALDRFLLEESERNLRAMGFLGDVSVVARDVGDSAAIVTVRTQEKWTIDVLPAYKQEGGVQWHRFTLKDDNLLGGGYGLSMSYDYRSDRGVPYGGEVTFHDRNLFGTRFRGILHHRNSWEHTSSSLLLERPYFSDRTPWAGGVFLESGRRRVLFYDGGALANEEETQREMQKAWVSVSTGNTTLFRPTVAYIRTRTAVSDPRVIDNLDLITLTTSVLRRTYVERSFLNNFGRVEDVPLGFSAAVTIGKNFPTTLSPGPAYLVALSCRQAFQTTEWMYWAWSCSYESFWGGWCGRESTVDLLLLNHIKISRNQVLVAQLSGTAGLGWSGRRQMTLGSSSGLRGFDEYALAGDRRLTYGIEHRFFTDVDFFIFRFGAAAFLDGGTAWSGDAPLGRQSFFNAAGLGLRIENTKLQGSGLIRIDWVMNLNEGRSGHIILSSRLPFSAFLDLDGVGSSQAIDGL